MDLLFQELELVKAQNDLMDAVLTYANTSMALEQAAALPPGSLSLYGFKSDAGNVFPKSLFNNDLIVPDGPPSDVSPISTDN